ncbi:MAG: phosphoglucosamine mutase [Desulfurococcales archaeon]|nr:phosphoglucosamine mutase [Desulfurococcales archaeon]
MGKYFGTDGIRGVVPSELTPQLAVRAGYAVGSHLGRGSTVIVGRDVRRGGEYIVRGVISGLLVAGVKVFYAGFITTPGLQFLVYKNEWIDGGIMVTASHNPPEYNGIKVFNSKGIEISKEDEEAIEEIMDRETAPSTTSFSDKVIEYPDPINDYIDSLVNFFDVDSIREAGISVLVDAANSVAGMTTPSLLSKIGVRVITLNAHFDPNFPGREPEPTTLTLKETARATAALDVSFAVAHDADGDRAIFIDEIGEIWWGDKSATLMSAYLAKKHPELPKRVYTGVPTSMLVEEFLSERGIEVVWEPVGSRYLSLKLMYEGGIAGFEENGGFIYPVVHYVRDGAVAAALFAEMLAKERVPASKLFSQLPRYYSIKTKYPMSREEAYRAMERVKRAYEGYKMVLIDGVKVFGDEYWFLVRPSGTEPVIRVIVEARSRKQAENVLREVERLILG